MTSLLSSVLSLLLLANASTTSHGASSSSSSSSFGVFSSRVASKQRHEQRMQDAYRKISESMAGRSLHTSPKAKYSTVQEDYDRHAENMEEDKDLDYESDVILEEDENEEDYKYDRFEPTIRSLPRKEHRGYPTSSSRSRSLQPPVSQQGGQGTFASLAPSQQQNHHPFLQVSCRLVLVDDKDESTQGCDLADGQSLEGDDHGSGSRKYSLHNDRASSSKTLPRTSPAISSKQKATLSTTTTSCNCCIDTGAQRTVMSLDCVRASGLMPYLDRRYEAKAIGVGGSVQVLGRIPAGVVQLQFQQNKRNKFDDDDGAGVLAMAPSITVIERVGPKTTSTGAAGGLSQQPIDLLLGLDFLREHESVLDLQQNDIQLRVHGQPVRVPFLKPKHVEAESVTYHSKYGGGIGRNRNAARDDYADFSDDEEYDSELEGVDLTGY